jgi:hypothetical protein
MARRAFPLRSLTPQPVRRGGQVFVSLQPPVSQFDAIVDESAQAPVLFTPKPATRHLKPALCLTSTIDKWVNPCYHQLFLLAARKPQAAGEKEARCGERATRLFLGGPRKETRMTKDDEQGNERKQQFLRHQSPITTHQSQVSNR